MVSKQSGSARKVCRTCGGDGVLIETAWVNGREIDEVSACPDCGDEDSVDDHETETCVIDRDQRDFDDMAADQHERYLGAFGPGFFEAL